MATCSKCNTQQPDGLNYCIKCGNLLGMMPQKKGVPAKGLILGGCGCAILLSILVGIVIILVIVMISMQRQGPSARPQPTAAPTEQPASPGAPSAPQPQVEEFPSVKEEEIMILFAKGITEDGKLVDVTTEFSPSDPGVVQVILWGPNTLAKGSCVVWVWFYEEKTQCYTYNYKVEEEGRGAVVDLIKRPEKGFVKGKYTAAVFVDETQILTHSFTVN